MRRWRKALRWIGITCGVLVAAAMFVVLGVGTWLRTRPGEAFLRRQILERLGGAIQGRIEIDSLRASGFLRIELSGVRLFAPGDESPAIAADRIGASLSLTALLRRSVSVRELVIDRPEVRLIPGEDGNSLARVFRRRHPSPPGREEGPPAPSSPLHLHASRVQLRNGSFELGGSYPIELNGLDIDGTVDGTLDALLVSAALKGALVRPIERPVILHLRGTYGPIIEVELLSLLTGESRAELSGLLAWEPWRAAAEIDELHVTPDVLSAFLPRVELQTSVTIHGKARLEHRELSARLAVVPGTGEATIDASLAFGESIRELLTYRAKLTFDRIEPQRIRDGFPMGVLTARASLEGVGVPLTGTAHVQLDASGSRFKRLPIEVARLTAKVKGRRADISELTLRAASVDLSARGWASVKDSSLDIRAQAGALARTRSLLETGLGLHLPELRGALTLAGHLEGPYANPRLQATLDAPELAAGSNGVQGFRLSANLSRVRPALVGSFSASVQRAQLGKRSGEQLWMEGQVDGQRVSVRAKGDLGGQPVQLLVQGDREAHAKRLEQWSFSRFEGRALGLSMAAVQPFQATYEDGRLLIQRLRLSGDLGAVALDADVTMHGRVAATFRVDAFPLEKLPADLLPEGLNLSGVASVAVEAKGSFSAPQVAATLQLQSGRVRALTGIELKGELQWAQQRLSGNLLAGLGAGGLELKFDTPVRSFAAAFERGAPPMPIAVTLVGRNIALHDLGLLPKTPFPATGTTSGRMDIQGTIQSPQMDVTWRVDDASAGSLQNFFSRFHASYAQGAWQGELIAKHKDTLDLSAEARLLIPADEMFLGQLLWRERPSTANVRLGFVDLAWLSVLGYGPPDLAGTIAGRLALRGLLGKPAVNGTVKVTGLAGAGYEQIDAIADFEANDRVALNADAWMAGRPLAEVAATIHGSVSRISERGIADLFGAPLSLRGSVAKTDLTVLLPRTAPVPGDQPPAFDATGSASVAVTGTLDAPQAKVHVVIDERQHKDGDVGALTADLDYRYAKTTLSALFRSPQAGDLRLTGELQANLGASALRSGTQRVREAPMTLALDADQFDLALANGFYGGVRNLKGKVDVHLRKVGPLLPFVTGLGGTISVSGGELALLGAGRYSDVSLKASGQFPALTIEELKGKAGDGSFNATARLERTTPDQFQGQLSVQLKNVPVIENFQTRGVLSLKLDASGTGDVNHIEIPKVTIREWHMVIPEKLPRRIQSLQPHPDIELAHGKRAEKRPERGTRRFSVTVEHVEVPNDLVVDAPLGNKLTLGADLRMVYDPTFEAEGDPAFDMTGKVRIVRGSISLLKKFEIDEGDVTFFAHQIDDPAVAVKAHYDGPDAKISVSITGTLQNPERQFESNPSMSENEILYYLATGQRQTRPQQTDAVSLQTQLADATISALGAAAIGVVQGAVQNLLPKEINPDVLSVETDVQRAGIGRVRAGKYYFNGKLYVGGQYHPSANPLLNENTYEGEAEYRLGGNQYVRLLVGNEGHHTLYYLIERSFPTAKQRKNGVR